MRWSLGLHLGVLHHLLFGSHVLVSDGGLDCLLDGRLLLCQKFGHSHWKMTFDEVPVRLLDVSVMAEVIVTFLVPSQFFHEACEAFLPGFIWELLHKLLLANRPVQKVENHLIPPLLFFQSEGPAFIVSMVFTSSKCREVSLERSRAIQQSILRTDDEIV